MGEKNSRRTTKREKRELKMLVPSELRQQMGEHWGGVGRGAAGAVRSGPARHCYSTFDTENTVCDGN